MYPPQPPNGPDEGGHHQYPSSQPGPYGEQPYGGQPEQPQPYGAPPGPAGPYGGHPDPYGAPPDPYGAPSGPQSGSQEPARMPGTAIAVRVLMFIGGVFGLLFGGLFLLSGIFLTGDNEVTREFAEVSSEMGMAVSAAEVAGVLMVLGTVTLAYGLLSTALASFMGRRSPVVLWLIVAFHVLAALTLVFSMVGAGDVFSSIPFLFAVGMIIMMVLPVTRAYYQKPPANPYVAY